jgi:hypothetical protein
LSEGVPGGHHISPSAGERRRVKSLRDLSNRKAQKRQHFGCKDSAEAQESKSPLRIREEKLRRESVFIYIGETQGKEFAEERSKG